MKTSRSGTHGTDHALRWVIPCFGMLSAMALACALLMRSSSHGVTADHPDRESVPFDIRKVVNQVHFAFRNEGAVWRGGHSTYEVRLAGEMLEVTPYHHPSANPGDDDVPESTEGAEGASPARRPRAPMSKRDAVRFAAAQVARGQASLMAGRPQVARSADGQLVRVHDDGAVEHLRNGPDGVEQSWSFDRPPNGDGDLEVRVPVAIGKYLGATENGLHFSER